MINNSKKRINIRAVIFLITIITIVLLIVVFLLTKNFKYISNVKEEDYLPKVEDNNIEENNNETVNEKPLDNITNNEESNEEQTNIEKNESTNNNEQNNTENNDIPKEPDNIVNDNNNTDNTDNTNNTNNTGNKENTDNKINNNNSNSSNNNSKFGSNVAFIGDSRTQALLMYGGLNNVNDYTKIGLMVDTAVTKKFITNSSGNKITILDDMKSKNIDTVYIMLGINELGWVYSSVFIKDYENLIDKILEIKPNCKIIVQSIIPVTKTKSDNDSIYNNKKISEYNSLIKEMANRKKIKYIDLVPVLADKNGNLPEDASTDGVHLNKEYCLKWLEYLKNN